MLKFVKIERDRTFNLMLPKRMTPESAGYDLQADLEEPFTLFPTESTVIPTGLSVGIPDGYQGLLFSRSGHGCVPTGVRAPNVKASNGVGVIDRDFRGELKVCLQNTGSVEKIINPGDRIAQLVLVQVYEGEAEWVASLDLTERTGGFGSTGENIAKSNTPPTTVP